MPSPKSRAPGRLLFEPLSVRACCLPWVKTARYGLCAALALVLASDRAEPSLYIPQPGFVTNSYQH